MNIRKIKKIIYQYLDKYNSEYFITPKIDNIEFIGAGVWCQFDTKKMYERQYILKVNPELFNQNDNFIKQILYHEFTHMYDSTIFLEYDLESYKKIMQIYSEVHATEIETDILITTQSKPYSLRKTVIHQGELTLISYMDQSLKYMENEFTPPIEKITLDNLKFDYKELYYFIGKLLALKDSNIEYTYEYSGVPTELQNIIQEITQYFIENTEYNYDILLELQNKFSEMISKYIKMHNSKIAMENIENLDTDTLIQRMLQNNRP